MLYAYEKHRHDSRNPKRDRLECRHELFSRQEQQLLQLIHSDLSPSILSQYLALLCDNSTELLLRPERCKIFAAHTGDLHTFVPFH